jgi:hypothetical protein
MGSIPDFREDQGVPYILCLAAKESSKAKIRPPIRAVFFGEGLIQDYKAY